MLIYYLQSRISILIIITIFIILNVQLSHETKHGNRDEVDDLIQNAIANGVFQSKDQWIREHSRNANVTNLMERSLIGKTVRRTVHENAEETVSDRPNSSSDDSIKFPGNPSNSQNPFVPKPGICNGESICATVPDYPETAIRNALKRHKGELFSTNDLPDNEDLNVGQRFGSLSPSDSRSETVEFCTRQIERIQPKSGININGESRYIVNLENVTHIVAIEKCLNEHSQCNFTTGLLVLGYYPDCVQKYVQRDLHALQPDGTSIRLETFRIPASCCCELRFDGSMNRMKNDKTAV